MVPTFGVHCIEVNWRNRVFYTSNHHTFVSFFLIDLCFWNTKENISLYVIIMFYIFFKLFQLSCSLFWQCKRKWKADVTTNSRLSPDFGANLFNEFQCISYIPSKGCSLTMNQFENLDEKHMTTLKGQLRI